MIYIERTFILFFAGTAGHVKKKADKKITENKPDTKNISLNRDKAKDALLKAKAELEAKAKDFEASDMQDIAKEFHTRVKNITDALSYNP